MVGIYRRPAVPLAQSRFQILVAVRIFISILSNKIIHKVCAAVLPLNAGVENPYSFLVPRSPSLKNPLTLVGIFVFFLRRFRKIVLLFQVVCLDFTSSPAVRVSLVLLTLIRMNMDKNIVRLVQLIQEHLVRQE